MEGLSEYELQRLKNIAQNNAVLESMGLGNKHIGLVKKKTSKSAAPRTASRTAPRTAPCSRRSGRLPSGRRDATAKEFKRVSPRLAKHPFAGGSSAKTKSGGRGYESDDSFDYSGLDDSEEEEDDCNSDSGSSGCDEYEPRSTSRLGSRRRWLAAKNKSRVTIDARGGGRARATTNLLAGKKRSGVTSEAEEEEEEDEHAKKRVIGGFGAQRRRPVVAAQNGPGGTCHDKAQILSWLDDSGILALNLRENSGTYITACSTGFYVKWVKNRTGQGIPVLQVTGGNYDTRFLAVICREYIVNMYDEWKRTFQNAGKFLNIKQGESFKNFAESTAEQIVEGICNGESKVKIECDAMEFRQLLDVMAGAILLWERGLEDLECKKTDDRITSEVYEQKKGFIEKYIRSIKENKNNARECDQACTLLSLLWVPTGVLIESLSDPNSVN